MDYERGPLFDNLSRTTKIKWVLDQSPNTKSRNTFPFSLLIPCLSLIRLFYVTLLIGFSTQVPHLSVALAGPELSLREFASGQIKKGVRSIGMGGDGATWRNYSLIYNDADTALFDAGTTHFADTGDNFSFTAVGATTPAFWDGGPYFI